LTSLPPPNVGGGMGRQTANRTQNTMKKHNNNIVVAAEIVAVALILAIGFLLLAV